MATSSRSQRSNGPSGVSHFRPHPWHGLPVGPKPPDVVYAFIEMTVFDVLKCEVDKPTGYVKIHRPLPSSSLPPAAYGFIPRTWCDDRVARLSPGTRKGDGDPLDILVVSEREISRVELIAPARVLGGFQMQDKGADDKIVAVLESDLVWGKARSLDDLPQILVDRIEHYLRTYKQIAGRKSNVRINRVYGPAHAKKVIRAAMADYDAAFGEH